MEKILISKFLEKFSPRCQWKTCSMGNPLCMGNRNQNNADLVCQWAGMSVQHKTPPHHGSRAGEKTCQRHQTTRPTEFCETKISFRWCCYLSLQRRDSSPLEFPALLCRTMRRGKQQLGFLLSAWATKPPFTRGTFQIMHIQHKRDYVVSGNTFDNKGQYSNNMVSSCAGCMKRTLPSKFLWLFFVAIYCSSVMLPWHQQRHQREPACLLFSPLEPSHLWIHLGEDPAALLGQLLCWAQDLPARGENRNFPISPQYHHSLSIPELNTWECIW